MVEVYFVTNDVRRLLRAYATLKPLRNTVERYILIMISSRVAD
jgi:hypothetical protein